jgi:DNA replication protein DnaC
MNEQLLPRGRNLLQSIERIGNLAVECKGEPEKMIIANQDYHTVCEFIEVEPLQAAIFSVIFMLNFNTTSVYITEMAKFMESSNMKVLMLLPEIEALEQRRLICRNSSRGRIIDLQRVGLFEIGYFIPKNILEGILKGDKTKLRRRKDHSMVSLLEEIASLIEEGENGNVSFDEISSETQILLNLNRNLGVVKKIMGFKLKVHELLLLLYICRETVNGTPASDLVNTCEKIFHDVDCRFRIRQGLVRGTNELIKKGILKLRDGYWRTDKELLLTDKGLDEIFGQDIELLKAKDTSLRDLILHGTLKETRLYFNSEEQEQLDFVTRLLHQTNFNKTKNRLEKLNMPAGVAILFHGSPGTGKTASVYEIARKTGRDIFMVDISNTKSMWFGESEKTIKELFDKYRRKVQNSKKTPILLFNECDAVFSTRKEIGSSPIDQTENAIQNIILQEIESLKGIMIATTNLTKNLDTAFERRFLFKIEFHKPGPEVLQKIWMDKIPTLKASDAQQLSERFDLSGGNIENIARKVQMHQILHGEYPGFDRLLAYCDEEQMVKSNRKQVGYKI